MNRLICALLPSIAIAALTLLPSAGKAHAQTVELPKDAALAQLRPALSPQRDSSHMRALAAIRQLRDPALKTFFERLLQTEYWQMHVHAVLGLAELDPAKTVNVALLDQVDFQAHESIVASGLDLKLITPEQLSAILKSEDLTPMARLFALAELVSLQQPVDRASLNTLSQSSDVHIAGLSAALLAQLGDAAAFDRFAAAQASAVNWQRPQTAEPIVWLLEAQRRYTLTSCAPWIKSLLESSDVPREVRARCILTLLELDPQAGAAAWERELGSDATYEKRVRMALLLLANVNTVKPELFERVRSAQASSPEDEPLITALIRAGRAAAAKEPQSEPLRELLALRHARSAEWAMVHLRDLQPSEAVPVYEFLLDRLKDGPEHEDDPALAIEAATRLVEINPKSLMTRLTEAEDDSPLQQSIVLGLLERTDASFLEPTSKIRRIGSGRADSLVLLLIAKLSPTVSEADRTQLGVMAAGGGRLSDALQVQAAWLYLKHTGQGEQAVTELFAE